MLSHNIMSIDANLIYFDEGLVVANTFCELFNKMNILPLPHRMKFIKLDYIFKCVVDELHDKAMICKHVSGKEISANSKTIISAALSPCLNPPVQFVRVTKPFDEISFPFSFNDFVYSEHVLVCLCNFCS
ncbi:hypothetical protein CHS0354_027904 [Potamilus streckersoni]|uniref:Uncharacterized protein n=1 Tax=Potamilus streckersoni TaxID=2493646 RepID=A0AAE0T3G6_9BIVA|nr:hypothetical protein CHS0354_027904 [Potamilus streckersoni]